MEKDFDNMVPVKKKWTATDELYMHLDRASCVNSNFVELINNIKKYNHVDAELKPIGIYLNNKIVEIYHYYEKRGVSYDKSGVNRSIINYLIELTEQALNALNQYVRSNTGMINIIRGLRNKSIGGKYLEQYNDICNQILNFSIEKDAVKAINSYFDIYMSEEWYDGQINRDIDYYNEELSQLGIDNKVDYCDDKNFTCSVKKPSDEDMVKINDMLNQIDEASHSNFKDLNELIDMSSISPETRASIEGLLNDMSFVDSSVNLDLESKEKNNSR